MAHVGSALRGVASYDMRVLSGERPCSGVSEFLMLTYVGHTIGDNDK